jgi:hypothetical protein
MRAEELLAIANPLVDCEWKAAHRYDDGSRSVKQLAEQILGVCSVERFKVRLRRRLSRHASISSAMSWRLLAMTVPPAIRWTGGRGYYQSARPARLLCVPAGICDRRNGVRARRQQF